MVSNLSVLVPQAENFDMIAFTFQEVPRSKKSQRFAELSEYLHNKGFVAIDNSFCQMWEMLLVIFIK